MVLTERAAEFVQQEEEFFEGRDRFAELRGHAAAEALTFEQAIELVSLGRAETELAVAQLRVQVAQGEVALAQLRLEAAEREAGVAESTTSAVAMDAEAATTLLMQVAVSILVLGVALYVLLVRRDPPEWAAGIVGAIVGYWLPR